LFLIEALAKITHAGTKGHDFRSNVFDVGIILFAILGVTLIVKGFVGGMLKLFWSIVILLFVIHGSVVAMTTLVNATELDTAPPEYREDMFLVIFGIFNLVMATSLIWSRKYCMEYQTRNSEVFRTCWTMDFLRFRNQDRMA